MGSTIIGVWSHSAYLKCSSSVDVELLQIMLDLNTMELGDQFAISYKMPNKIADDLIVGKDVDLNSEDYLEI